MFDEKEFPYCAKGHKYATDVIAGKVVACEFIKGACERYLRDLENADAWFEFVPEKAERYLKMVQRFEHIIGKWGTSNIVFEPWQCWVWMNIYGFRNKENGFRRFRQAHIEVARGNAKSTMASQCALYELALDNPKGNEISTVATKKEQARIVFDASRAMARENKSYLKATGTKVLAHVIVHPKSNSKMRSLSSESSSLDGLNDVLAIMDELHAMKRSTYEVILSGMSKRKDSLLLCITTAGFDTDSIGHGQSSYAKKVAIGHVPDDTFFAAVYTLDENDEWDDPKVWAKANPNLGVSVDLDSITQKVEKAKVTPSDAPNIKVKNLNMWISEANAFFDLQKWDRCADPSLKIEDFKRVHGKMGMDLASNIDITSTPVVFRKDDIYYIFDNSYMPEETIRAVRSSNSLFDDCVAQGHLHATAGATINHEFIRKQVERLISSYRIKECYFDKWTASEMAQKLSNKCEMISVSMNVANLSEPMKKLDSLIREGKVRHNGSPLLRWCLGNVVAKVDQNGNVFPRKSSQHLKIDPIVGVILAMAGWVQEGEVESIYEVRGFRSV